MAICPKCGSELREGAKFCGKCGTAIQQPKIEVNGSYTCPVCGKEIRSGARFCSACGADLQHLPQENLPSTEDSLLSINSDYMQWNIIPGQIAVRIDESDMDASSGLKGIIIQPGIKAFIIADGKIVGELDAGNYKFDSILSAKTSLFQRFKSYIKKIFLNRGNAIEGARFISVVLLRGIDFPLVCSYKALRCKDIAVDVSLHFICRIANIIKFYENLLVDRKSVTYNSFSAFLSEDIRSIVSRCIDKCYADLEDTDKLSEELYLLLDSVLQSVYPFLHVQRIVSFSTSNEDMERIRKLQDELFVSENELDHLTKRNDFISRLNSENYRYELNNAESEADFLALMEKIDEKKLLTEDEREKFASLLASQKKLREAKTEDEEAVVLSAIRKNNILRDSEIAELERMVAHKSELQGLSDAQVIAKATLENKIETGKQELRYETEVGNQRLANDIKRKEAEDRYQEEKRQRQLQLEKEESLSQLELLKQAQAIRIEREEAEHRRKLEEMKTSSEAELERNKLYAAMSVEQIMAINPNISPAAAAALAEKFKSESSEDKLKMAMSQKDEMRSFMESQMSLMRDMIVDNNSIRKDMLKAKDDEIARVRADSNSHESRYAHVMETTVQAVSGVTDGKKKQSSNSKDVIICPACGSANSDGSAFCAECGESLKK